MEIAPDIQSQFSPIWQIFLPVYYQPTNMAEDFLSFFAILSSFYNPKHNPGRELGILICGGR